MTPPAEITPPHILAHKHSANHQAEIHASQLCACFYCLATYPPAAIQDWIHSDQTATCPHCGIDSVLGDASGFPLTPDFLQQMHDHWFSTAKTIE